MVDWVRDNSLHPFFITFMKNGKGVDLVFDNVIPDDALVDGDVILYTWKPLPEPRGTITKRVIDISAELVKVDATDAPGRMQWFPLDGDTRCNCFLLVLRDASGHDAFDENSVGGYTHGRFNQSDLDDNSRFNGI